MFILRSLAIIASLTLPASLAAAESATPRPEKKIITYLGMEVIESLEISAEHAAIAELVLRRAVEMKRFDYVDVIADGPLSMDEFLGRYRDLVQQKGNTPGWAKDKERIERAAYFYELVLTSMDIQIESDDRGWPTAVVRMTAALEFYGLDLSDPKKPTYVHLATVPRITPQETSTALDRDAAQQGQLGEAVGKCAAELGNWLAIKVRQLPLFKLTAVVSKVEGDTVSIPMGKSLGVKLDTAFEIHKKTPDGGSLEVGYAKVRKITKEDCTAELITSASDWTFAGDETAEEDANFGMGLMIAPVLEWTSRGVIGENGPGLYPGALMIISTNLADSVDISEFHLQVVFDFMYLGRAAGPNPLVSVGHAGLGFIKKWYLGRVGLSAGLGAGVAYYIYEEDGLDTDSDFQEKAHIAFGGDLLLGGEIFISPSLAVVLRLAARYYMNPIDWTNMGSPKEELGVQTAIGIQYSF